MMMIEKHSLANGRTLSCISCNSCMGIVSGGRFFIVIFLRWPVNNDENYDNDNEYQQNGENYRSIDAPEMSEMPAINTNLKYRFPSEMDVIVRSKKVAEKMKKWFPTMQRMHFFHSSHQPTLFIVIPNKFQNASPCSFFRLDVNQSLLPSSSFS